MSDVPTYEVILIDAPDMQAKTAIGEGLAAYNVQHTDDGSHIFHDVFVLPARTGGPRWPGDPRRLQLSFFCYRGSVLRSEYRMENGADLSCNAASRVPTTDRAHRTQLRKLQAIRFGQSALSLAALTRAPRIGETTLGASCLAV